MRNKEKATLILENECFDETLGKTVIPDTPWTPCDSLTNREIRKNTYWNRTRLWLGSKISCTNIGILHCTLRRFSFQNTHVLNNTKSRQPLHKENFSTHLPQTVENNKLADCCGKKRRFWKVVRNILPYTSTKTRLKGIERLLPPTIIPTSNPHQRKSKINHKGLFYYAYAHVRN